jgi:hypothetical protein
MVRLPRFFEKKRGERRTGSQAWASFGEGAFYGALLLAGLVFGAAMATGVAMPAWRLHHDFVETRGLVVARGLVSRRVEDPPGAAQTTWQPCARVRYAAHGAEREAWSRPPVTSATPDRDVALAATRAYAVGTEVVCWFDPQDPDTLVLERGYNWWTWLLALLLPGALVAFGGTGFVRAIRSWGKSEEHRAASIGLPELLAPTSRSLPEAPGFPGVPTCDDHTNSPGTILRYRLPIESPESWALVGFGLFAGLWNAVVVVLAVGAGLDFVGGRTDWLLFGLLVPFVAVGIGGVALFVRAFVRATAVGPTQVEISDHPLRPGGRYELLVAQGGTGMFRTLEVALEVEEQATFRQGTDTRTERVVVWRQPVKSWNDIELSPGARFESQAALRLPEDVMHSFQSEHNSVSWRFVVRGEPARWPGFRRVFPVVAFPAAGQPAEPAGRSAQESRS